jgi:hypothetical protein
MAPKPTILVPPGIWSIVSKIVMTRRISTPMVVPT